MRSPVTTVMAFVVAFSTSCEAVPGHECPSDTEFPAMATPHAVTPETWEAVTISIEAADPVFQAPFDSQRSRKDLVFSVTNAPNPGPGDPTDPATKWISWSEREHAQVSPNIRAVEILDGRSFRFEVMIPANFGDGPYGVRVGVSEPYGSCRGGKALVDLQRR